MRTLRDETLSDLLRAMWSAKFYLVAGGLAGFMIAAVVVMLAVPHMRAVMVVAPVDKDVLSGLHVSEQGMPSQEIPAFLRYMKILTGPSVVGTALATDPKLLPYLNQNRRFVFQKENNLQSPAEISVFLSKTVVVKPVGDTPLRIIELELSNADLARDLLHRLHMTADGLLRQEALGQTDQRLAYLKETVAKTANADHRQALTALLMEQERQAMMLRMDQYYAADLVEAPYIYPKPVWPRKAYLFPLSVLIGMMMGWVIYGVVRSYR